MAVGLTQKNPKLPDDLMFLILLRCPVKTVFRFKCVSKTWDHNLSCSSFSNAYLSFQKELGVAPLPLLGFFHFKRHPPITMRVHEDEEVGPQGFSFLPVDNEGQPPNILELVDRVGSFRGISNGLILCGDHPDFHVINPFTRQSFSLPRAHIDIASLNLSGGFVDYHVASPGFFSSECGNDFQVVVPYVNEKRISLGEKLLQVETYSSTTGLWNQFNLVASHFFHVQTARLPYSIGGIFLWVTCEGALMVYDPHRVDDRVQLIRLPSIGSTRRSPTLCQSSDGLLQCAMDGRDFPGFRVFNLARKLDAYGYEAVVPSREWISKYNVRLDNLDAVWANPFDRAYNREHDRYAVRMAFLPSNPNVLIFRMGARIFSIDVENGQLNQIPHGGHHFFASELFVILPYVQPHWPPSPCRRICNHLIN